MVQDRVRFAEFVYLGFSWIVRSVGKFADPPSLAVVVRLLHS